jgi:hypothetical protein
MVLISREPFGNTEKSGFGQNLIGMRLGVEIIIHF